MKKILTVLLILSLICVTAAGCANGINARLGGYPAAQPGLSRESSARIGDGIDVDLTALSSMMIYAEVYNMMVSPDDYVGRTVKMSGPYYAQYYEETEQYYHFVIIEDATACCQQGLEFVWNGDHSYPDDYPADTTRIEVTGVFDSYEELGMIYYHLVVDDVVIL